MQLKNITRGDQTTAAMNYPGDGQVVPCEFLLFDADDIFLPAFGWLRWLGKYLREAAYGRA